VELQKICDRLGPGALKNFFWRWLHRLPSPFNAADFRAGYIYDLAFRQFEVSDTCVFDRPQAGRMWFEGMIRDHLDVGRPHQIALIFDRPIKRTTPGTFRTRVLTKGVDPTLCCYYKSSRLKQYFKEGKALRAETVICDQQRPVATKIRRGSGRRRSKRAAQWRFISSDRSSSSTIHPAECRNRDCFPVDLRDGFPTFRSRFEFSTDLWAAEARRDGEAGSGG
jgi:hypothetical protein